jgi:transposase
MSAGRLTTRRRESLTALVGLDTYLVVAVAQGRDSASTARLLAEQAPDATVVVACDLFSGFKTASATLDDAVVVADVFHPVQLALQPLDEVRRRRQQHIHGHRGHTTGTTRCASCVASCASARNASPG